MFLSQINLGMQTASEGTGEDRAATSGAAHATHKQKGKVKRSTRHRGLSVEGSGGVQEQSAILSIYCGRYKSWEMSTKGLLHSPGLF